MLTVYLSIACAFCIFLRIIFWTLGDIEPGWKMTDTWTISFALLAIAAAIIEHI